MTKFLSLFLSFSLLFSAVAPSYGQALESTRRPHMSYVASDEIFFPSYGGEQSVLAPEDTSTLTQAWERAQFRFYTQDLSQLKEKVRAAVSMLTDSEGQDDYAWFKRQYVAVLKATYESSLSMVRSAEEVETLRKIYEAQTAQSSIKKAYEEFFSAEAQPAARQGEQYIKDLGCQIYENGKKNYKAVLDLIEEALPVFASAGLLEPGVKEWAAGVLRQEVSAHMSSCQALGWVPGLLGRQDKKVQECESVLKSASALIVLGKDGNSQDAQVISDLLKKGYNGVLGPSVIMLTGPGLLAMGAEDLLVAFLYEVAQQQPQVGILGSDFSFINMQDWVKAAKSLWEGGDWAVGHEYSFYQQPEGKGLGNVWTDLGEYLGELSASDSKEGRRAAEVLDRMARQMILVGKDGALVVQFPVFVAGALAGGYRVKNMARAGWELDGNGKGHYVDTRANWQALERRLQQWGETTTGYAIAQLYFSGKSDLDPYTKVEIENRLAAGYKKNGGGRIKEISWRRGPSSLEINQYQNWSRAMRLGGQLDTALAVVGILAAGVGLVKAGASGVRALNQMGRVFKLARSGAAGSGLKATVTSYNRIVRLGRLQKYGVSSWRQAFISKISGFEKTTAKKTPSQTTRSAAVLPAAAETNNSAAAAKVPPVSKRQTAVKQNPSASAEVKKYSSSKTQIPAKGASEKNYYKGEESFPADLEEQLRRAGGERLVRLVQNTNPSLTKRGNKSLSSGRSKGSKGVSDRKQPPAQAAAGKQAPSRGKDAKASVLSNADNSFFEQKPTELLAYLRQTYDLNSFSLKDIKQILNRAEALPKATALKKAIMERVEQLLKNKQALLRNYFASTGRKQAHPSVRVYYLGDKEKISLGSFQPKHIVLNFEEVLHPSMLNSVPGMARRVTDSRSIWSMNIKGSASIIARRGKTITSKDVARLYQDLLNCSSKQPCRYILDTNGTLLLYPSQGRIWLRVGEHEMLGRFHLHLHTDRYVPVPGGVRNGQERIILNYRLPLVNIEQSFRPLKHAKGSDSFARNLPVRQTPEYLTFVSGALEEMIRAKLAVPVK